MTEKFSRRGFMAATGMFMLATMAGWPQQAEAKMSKRKAGFSPRPHGRKKCANCKLYNKSSHTCTVVNGRFSPSAWCRLWVG